MDDVLCISENGLDVIKKEMGRYIQIKNLDKNEPPDINLGNKVSMVTLENGKEAWSFSSSQYIQAAVKNVKEYLKSSNQVLSKRVTSPFKGDYSSELDTSTELDCRQAAYYQSLIGV